MESGSLTRRDLLGSLLKASAIAAVSSTFATAQPPNPSSTLIDDLVAANRILAQQGILDGYGHASVRHDAARDRYLLSRSLAPALVTAADIQVYDLDSNALDPAARPCFIERFIHGEVYRARPDVHAVVHSHAPSLIPFGVTGTALRPLYHMTAFVGEGVPVFEIRKPRGNDPKMLMLVHNPALGRSLAETLGSKPAVLMRGHGAVIVGASLPQVVGRSVYLALNATLQAQAMALGGSINYLDPQEAREEIPDNYQRAWDLWKRQAMSADCAAPRMGMSASEPTSFQKTRKSSAQLPRGQ
ncbi:MAG TPA: class II aldolase/adducin family protein [Terriglobales bacterium]|nr:class II aldolase/adducin family protein [Terriglobales bacterium]